MRNTGILLFLAGIYIIVNSGSFRDLLFGKAKIGFITPGSDSKQHGPNPDAVADPASYGPTTPQPKSTVA